MTDILLRLCETELAESSVILDVGCNWIDELKRHLFKPHIHISQDSFEDRNDLRGIPRFIWDPTQPCPLNDVWDMVIRAPISEEELRPISEIVRLWLVVSVPAISGKADIISEWERKLEDNTDLVIVKTIVEENVLWAILRRVW